MQLLWYGTNQTFKGLAPAALHLGELRWSNCGEDAGGRLSVCFRNDDRKVVIVEQFRKRQHPAVTVDDGNGAAREGLNHAEAVDGIAAGAEREL